MPDISLDLQAIDFITDQQVAVRAWRAFVKVRFDGLHGPRIRYETFLDPGAPFSVIPYSLWHGRRLRWRALGTQFTRAGHPVAGSLTWQGAPCELGTTDLYLLDLAAGIRTGPHRVVAKFVQQALPQTVENAAILGMSFLADNELRLVLEGIGGRMSGVLSVPGP